jgi:hypothetical protein
MPMETNVIEFDANEEKDWFFHCHVLYHMMAGMGRVFSYENSPPNTQVPPTKANWNFFKKEDERMIHPMMNLSLHSNGVFGHGMVSNNYYFAQTDFHANPKYGFEIENKFGRYFGAQQFFIGYIGFQAERKKEHGKWENEVFGTVGFEYTLPMFVKADARVNTNGRFRLQLSREDIALSRRLRADAMWNTDKEYQFGLRYAFAKRWQISTNYHNEYKFGGGITYSY